VKERGRRYNTLSIGCPSTNKANRGNWKDIDGHARPNSGPAKHQAHIISSSFIVTQTCVESSDPPKRKKTKFEECLAAENPTVQTASRFYFGEKNAAEQGANWVCVGNGMGRLKLTQG